MRNRICTLCLLLFMVLFPLFAASVDSGKAAHVAERFMQQQQETMLRSSSLSLQLVYTAPSSLRSGTLEAAYYIYNVEGDNGFVIVSGDDRAVPILGYAVQGAFDPARMSPDMHSWLQRYQDQIEWAVAEGIAPASNITEQWQAIDSDLSSGTLRSSKLLSSANWAQNDPYNADCPTIGGQRTLTGCSATAMAILMRYHQWPTKGTGSHSYSWNGTTLSVTFDTTYDWANMPLNINSASSAQKNNIAKIMSDCGRSINSSYGVNATSATLSAVAASLKQFFKYDSGLAVKGRNTMSYDDWYSLVKSEIDADRLVYYSGQSSSGGHAFICDGYDGENYIHINWGWGSLHNGSFMIDALNGDGNDYSNSEQIIVGVKPGSDVEEPIEPGLKLVDTYGYSGMLINVENVVSGSSFKIEMGSVMNSTMTGFNGELSVGLFSADNNLKEVLIENNTRSLSVNSYFPSLTLLCNVSGEVANSDILKPITKVNGSDKWQVVTGEGSAVAQLKAKGNTVTRYPVTWTNRDNLAVSMYNYCQTNEAVKGMSYVFKINNPSEVSLVKVNGEVITPNTLDLYWIRQVQSALTIEINPVDPIAVNNISLNKTELELTVGESFTLVPTITPANATNKNVSWSSSNAKVSVVNGVVTAEETGTATITVTTEDGNKSAQCVVTVTAATVAVSSVQLSETNRNIKQGEYFILTATVLPENATNKAVSWSSSDRKIVTVDDDGLVTSAGDTGTATITVTTEDGNKSAQCVVTVTAATVAVSSVQLSEINRNIKQGESFTLTATVLPENATNKVISWSSSNTTVATVSNEGLVTSAGDTGSATITVTTEDGNKSAQCVVTVTAATVVVSSVKLSEINRNIKQGESFTLTATVLPENATNKAVSWSSSNTTV
ncbi:C10 family peptidase, partial [Parabacteroides sp. OttesenSCG-928-N08]|nr:C10 family peptidase [Parabacteroides sp. OttesenSCG-928-N08]